MKYLQFLKNNPSSILLPLVGLLCLGLGIYFLIKTFLFLIAGVGFFGTSLLLFHYLYTKDASTQVKNLLASTPTIETALALVSDPEKSKFMNSLQTIEVAMKEIQALQAQVASLQGSIKS